MVCCLASSPCDRESNATTSPARGSVDGVRFTFVVPDPLFNTVYVTYKISLCFLVQQAQDNSMQNRMLRGWDRLYLPNLNISDLLESAFSILRLNGSI